MEFAPFTSILIKAQDIIWANTMWLIFPPCQAPDAV